MRIGILTSGGDCPALNAVIRGFAKYMYNNDASTEIFGIPDGYGGLISGEYKLMKKSDFSGILNLGGTILGTSRQPFKKMMVEDNNVTKVDQMVANYKKMGLDCLAVLGGAGTHKSAHLLSEAGCNVVGFPKTIDNDIFGTDTTFGFHSAVDIATEAIDRLHTTAQSHGRTMIVEIMGNKVGWLTLYAGVAGGADVILLPEIPFSVKAVADKVKARADAGKDFTIIAIAEGAMLQEEAVMRKKDRVARRAEKGITTLTTSLCAKVQQLAGVETRSVILGHVQRGGAPSPYDRVISTNVGSYAGKLVCQGIFGVSVALDGHNITYNKLSDIAGKSKLVPLDHSLIQSARGIGISFGDEYPFDPTKNELKGDKVGIKVL